MPVFKPYSEIKECARYLPYTCLTLSLAQCKFHLTEIWELLLSSHLGVKQKPNCTEHFYPDFLKESEFKTVNLVFTQPVNTNVSQLRMQVKADGMQV